MARSLRWRSERHALPGEVQSLGPGVDGAIAARVGRGGGPGGRTWRHHGGSARHGDRVLHDSTRPPGVGCATPRRPAADSAPRRRPQENAGEGSDPADRPRRVGGADRVGTSQSPLRWTSKSVRHLTEALQRMGHAVSRQLVAELLAAAGYSLQANRKTREGPNHPDRDAQFRYINQQVRRFQASGQPVISVDTKKKDLVGDFKNAGRQWRPTGQPEPVRVHDFLIPERGKAIPYGVYDLTRNAGWVSVGIDHDTATFAAQTIGRWWRKMGRPRYRRARSLLITADAGGSNGARVRLWKWELQRLANRTRLAITVCHLPPGTSKWNRIEHRLFSYISTNWRGQPLVSLAVIVNLIGSTRTAAGLRVRCELDRGAYPKGQDVPDAEMATLNLVPHRFHGDWNYTIHPRRGRK